MDLVEFNLIVSDFELLSKCAGLVPRNELSHSAGLYMEEI